MWSSIECFQLWYIVYHTHTFEVAHATLSQQQRYIDVICTVITQHTINSAATNYSTLRV
jgi:hypothetical protein